MMTFCLKGTVQTAGSSAYDIRTLAGSDGAGSPHAALPAHDGADPRGSLMGRPRTRPLQKEAEPWAVPSSPVAEARSLLHIARRLGNVAAVRNTIAFEVKHARKLRLWSAREPWLAERIRNLIRFRRQVLREFDRLARTREGHQ